MIVLYILLMIVVVVLILPKALQSIGLHPNYNKQQFNFTDKKALIVTTSVDMLHPTKELTGVYASEMIVPYYEFTDANIKVDLCSINGGKIPLDPVSIKYPLITKWDRRFLKDQDAMQKLNNSIAIEDVEIENYDIVFIAGGFGAAYDLGINKTLGNKISKAYKHEILLGAVCHGVLGFRLAKDNNKPLVENKQVTGVTNKQITELGVTITPLHPETELRRQKAIYQSRTRFLDVLASFVVEDNNIVTGQNQNSGGEVAQRLMQKLLQK